MLINVGDQIRTFWLNLCFFAIVIFTITTIIPWKSYFGLNRVSRLSRWIFIPVLMLAVAYEMIMPSRYNIRVDLLLLFPMYAVIVLASVFRWLRPSEPNN
jgi:hypothetical protein